MRITFLLTVCRAQIFRALDQPLLSYGVAVFEKLEHLEQRVAELESGTMKYCGVHHPSLAYRKGHVVSYDGSAWCATRDVSVERPGHGDGWQLMVKHGKDASTATPRNDTSATAAERTTGLH